MLAHKRKELIKEMVDKYRIVRVSDLSARFQISDVTIRRDQSVSLAPAFEKPVTATRDSGYMTGSEKALAEYANRLERQGMAEPPALALCVGDMAQALGAQSVALPQLLEQIEAWIGAHVQDGGAV